MVDERVAVALALEDGGGWFVLDIEATDDQQRPARVRILDVEPDLEFHDPDESPADPDHQLSDGVQRRPEGAQLVCADHLNLGEHQVLGVIKDRDQLGLLLAKDH
jgi:hypothetical protein